MTLTLFNLENSRAFRVHWLACELKTPVQTRNYARIEGKKAVPELAKESGYALGKSPCIVDEDDEGNKVRVVESCNCMLYLVERYGPDSGLIPAPPAFALRTRVVGWMDFAETIMTHALAIVYAQWFTPSEHAEAVQVIEEKASVNVQKDLDEVERALESGPYVCGAQFTAADIALAFSCEYVLIKQVGTKGHASGWPRIHAWLRTIEKRDGYQQALREGPRYDFCILKLDKQPL